MKKILMTLALAAASAVSARPAEATFILSVSDGTNTATVSGATGATLTITGATLIANGFTYLDSTSFVQATDFNSGGSADSNLNLNNTLKSFGLGAPQAIRITAFDDGMTSPPGAVVYQTSGSFTLTNAGSTTVDWTGGVSPTDATPPGPPYDLTPTPPGFLLSTVSATSASSGSNTAADVPFFNSGSYTIAGQIETTLAAGGTAASPRVYNLAAQTNVTSAAIPEPSTIILLATFCAPMAGVYYRRRRMAK